jgi:hypothetical protein
MAEAITGKNGYIVLPVAAGGIDGDVDTGKFDGWSMTFNRPLLTLPDHWGRSTAGKCKVGMRAKATGSGRCYFSGTTPVLGTLSTPFSPATAGFELIVDSSFDTTDSAYTFSGLVTGWSHVVEKQGVQVIDITFESSGAIVCRQGV